MIKHGSMMINAVSNSTVPHISLLIGASYGAGHYGMCGRAYDPRFLFAWPSAKAAVMGGTQLAGVISIVSRAAAQPRVAKTWMRTPTPHYAPRSRRRSRPSRCRCSSRGGCMTTASSIHATPAPCWECACPPSPMARSRGRRTSASSGCEPHDHSSPGRQPRGDRAAGVRHLPPPRDRHRRRLHRPRRRFAACRRGRRPGAAGWHQWIPGRKTTDRRRANRRCGRDPSGIWIPLGELRIRRCRPGCGIDVGRAAGDGGRGDGFEDRGQEDDGRGRRAGARGARPRRRHRRSAAGADQGVGRRRRARHAGGARVGHAAVPGAGRPSRGAIGVRRPDGVLRALPGHRTPCRSPGARRRTRHRVGGRRTRMLDPAPPPEDHRGGAFAPGRTHTRHAGQAFRRGAAGRHRDRLHRCGHRRIHGQPRRPGRGRLLLPGDEHPAAGRASCHRGHHRHRSR